MIADCVESCETCKLLDKTAFETKHGLCPVKGKRRYSSWPCYKYESGIQKEEAGKAGK